jgi:PAS domain S-box-containing protein
MGSKVKRTVRTGQGEVSPPDERGSDGTDFRLLADALPHLVWLCRTDGTLDYLNHRGEEFLGADVGDACPLLSSERVHADDVPRAMAVWAEGVRGGEPLTLEARLRHCDGNYRWYLIHVQPVHDAQGQVVKWLGTATDVHEAREANDRSAFLLALSTEMAAMSHPQELVCAAMEQLRERLEASLVMLAELDEEQDEVVMLRNRDRDVSQIEIASLALEPFRVLTARAQEGLVLATRDVVAGDADAELYERWFGLDKVGAVISVPLLPAGELVAVLSVVQESPRDWSESDVELVRRVAEIVWPTFEKARADRAVEDALREMNRRKDEFLAMLSHELRNPLAPISSAVQILRNRASTGSELHWARTVIERQTRHLVRLVDDLLDVSRMERGHIVLQTHAIDLADVVRHGIETSRPLSRSRRHRLHVQLPPETVRVQGDLTRLAQVIANLLNNSAKYTEEGGDIWISAGIENHRAVIHVRDTGSGIAPDLLPHIFDLFTQAERTLDRSLGGLGIGLTLVKLLVELHGGSIDARSEGIGKGAEFIVRLPPIEQQTGQTTETPDVRAAETQREARAATAGTGGAGTVEASAQASEGAPQGTTQARESAPDSGSLRVLVVDDNVDAADSTAMLLSLDGFEAHSVHSAKEALDAFASLKPDVVLLDIGLPEMDGYDVARRLRAMAPGESPTIVALTGYGQPADRDRAASAGFDEFLVKPVEPRVLNELLRSFH